MARSIYVPQAGGFIDFSDNATDAEISAYLKSKYSPAPTPVEAPPPAGPQYSNAGLSALFGTGYLESFSDVPGGISSILTPEETAATQLSDEAKRRIREAAGVKEGEEWTIPQYAAYIAGQTAGFFTPVAGQAALVGKVASGAGKIGKATRAALMAEEAATGAQKLSLAGRAITGAPGAVMGGAGQAEQAREKILAQREEGMQISPEQQLTTQRLNFLIGTGQVLPVQRLAGPIAGLMSKVPARYAPVAERILASRLGRLATAAGAEGSQEALEGIASDLVEAGVYNPDVQIGQDIFSNAVGGGFAGSLLEGVLQVAAGRKMRGLRQLETDLGTERRQAGSQLRQGQISQAAEDLRQYNVEGPVDIALEEVDGLTGFTIKTPAGNSIGSFDTEADAQQAIDLYANATGAKVRVRAPITAPQAMPVKIGNKTFQTFDEIVAERDALAEQRANTENFIKDPELAKAEAAKQKVPEPLFRAATLKELKRQDSAIAALNAYIPGAATPRKAPVAPAPEEVAAEEVAAEEAVAEEPVIGEAEIAPDTGVETETAPIDQMPEDLADEKPIGYEPPIEEQRYIEEAPVVAEEVVPEENVPAPRIERRSSITADEVTALKKELFGEPLSHQDMTPEQIAQYEAERDARYPMVDQEVYYGAVPTDTTGRRMKEATSTVEPRPFTPEYKAKMDAVYTELQNRLTGIAPDAVKLNIQTFIDEQPGMLVRGEYKPGQRVIMLAQGIYDPSLTVEQLVQKMVGELNHESIHALRDLGLFRPAEWKMLSRAVDNKVPGKKYSYLDKARRIYTPNGEPISPAYANEDAVIEEAVAEMYRDWVNNKTAPVPVRGLLNRITEFIRNVFRVFRNDKHKDIFAQIEAGKFAERTPEARQEAADVRFSASPAAIQTLNGIDVVSFPEDQTTSSSVYLRRNHSQIKMKGKPNIAMLGAAFDRAFKKKFGRQYDITDPNDYNEIVNAIVDEVQYQMGQAQSGVGWYDSDIQDVFDELAKSFPILKDPYEGPAYQDLFTVIAGVMSNGMKAKANVELAAINFAHYLRTGEFSDIHPFTGKGWNQRSNIMGPQIKMLNSMINDPRFAPRPGSNNPRLERMEKFLDFMFDEHTVKDINKFRALHGTKSPAKIGGVDTKRLGMYAFGPKFGPFILNLNGLTDETVDSWASRSFYRHMGRSINPNGSMNDAPTGPAHREAMKRALRDIANRTKLSSRDVQAVLWFYEKELYNQLGQRIPLEVFSDGAREFTRKYGAGTEGLAQPRTDREREIAGAVEEAAALYDQTPERGARFSAAPVDPEEFQRWFRKSKVVNPDGTPKVMYHGTTARTRFTTFDTAASELGSHFGTQRQANKFVMIEEDEPRAGGRIYPVYLSIQNPIRLVDMGNWNNHKVADQIYPEGIIDKDLYERAMRSRGEAYLYGDNTQDMRIREELQRAIKKAGYDGIVYLNRFEGLNSDPENTINVDFGDKREITELTDAEFKKYIPEAEDSYIIFSPTQAKSVFNEFRTGESRRLRFSAVPLPTYVEQQNQTLFTQPSDVPFWKNTMDFFLGRTPGKTIAGPTETIDLKGRTVAALQARAGIVDSAAFVEFLEKERNRQRTGSFEREVTDTSALASLALRRRASHMTASFIMMGKLDLKYSTPGDILTAILKVENGPDSLKEVFKVLLEPGPVNSLNGKQQTKAEIFKAYASAIRGRDFKAKGLQVPRELTDQYINTVIPFTEQNYPDVVEAYKMYQRVNKNLLTTARDAGLLSSAELSRLTDKMNYYGFYREMYEEELVPGIPSKTASKFDLREYKGSDVGKLMGDPMQVIIANTQFWMDAIAKNLATTKTFNLAKDMGEARMLGASEKPDQSRGEAPEVMFFRQNGVQKRFAVKDPLLVTALGADERVDIGAAMKLIGLPTRVIRESITRDPGFMIANLLRDTLSSWITSGEDITPFIGTLKGGVDALKSGASFQALMGHGVVGSYDMAMQGPKELADTIRRRYTPKNIHMMTSGQGLRSAIGWLWDKSGVLSEASDAATRIAVYESARAQGLSEAEAAFRAIEILDFSRRGASQTLSLLTKLVPFLNARIQGLDVLYQAGTAAKRYITGQSYGARDANLGKQFLVRGAMLAAISMLLELWNEDDEDYKDIPDYIKTANLLIPLKWFGMPGQFLSIPKPFEPGLLFSTIPQQFVKTMRGDASTRDNIALFASQFAATFGVNPIPQIGKPFLEVLVNHDFYTGLPLVSEGKARLIPELQYDKRTSAIARSLANLKISYNFETGKFEGLSPITIDHLIRGYSGPIGSILVEAAGMAMERADIGPDRLPRNFSELPVIRRVFIDAESKNPKAVSQAYELFRIVDTANRSFSRLRQTGDAEAVKDFLDENRSVLMYKKYVFKLVDSLNKLSAQERVIERDDSMTRDQKLEAMNKLREVRIRLTAKVDEINKALGR